MSEKAKNFSSPRWINCPIEEEYIKEDRKEGKKQRKAAIAKDRSKYKKTDAEKYQKSLTDERNVKLKKQDLDEGLVISILPQGVIVHYEGKNICCSLKGLLKKDRTYAKNLIAVGDIVLFEKISALEGIISQILPRRTILSRLDNLSRRKEQMIAVNIEQVIITVSVVSPSLKPSLVDRYIIAAKKGKMEPLILINKVDLLEETSPDVLFEKERYEELLAAYKTLGIRVISISTQTHQGLEELKMAMKDKTSVFSGQSGVGKTSLINLVTGLNLKVGETVERTNKGSHTTTAAQLVPLEFGGWCVDTPGIKSFGVWNLKPLEIEGYFTEIHEHGLRCKFPNCTHLGESDCAVLQAVEKGEISEIRYESYQALIASLSEEHLRR